MIGFTLAIGEFMGGLLSAMVWIAAEFAAQLALGIGLLGGGVLLIRRWRSRHPH